MVEARKLPPELISLVHHVELNKAGWWDKAVQQLILTTIWQSGESLTAQAVLEKLADDFSVNLDADRVRKQIAALCAPGTLVALPGEKFKISEQSLAQFKADLGEAQKIQEEAKQRFIDIVRDCCPSVEAEAAWRSFNEGFLVPLIRDTGARTYELISGATIDFAAIPRVQEFLERYSTEIRAPLLSAVVAFMDPKDANIRSYILRQLSAYFFLEAGNLADETVRALSTMQAKTPSFTVFIDTNFLFSILGLHENPSNEAAQSLMYLVDRLAGKVALKLYVSPMTIDETRRALQACAHDLSDLRLPPNVAKPALTSGLSGLTRKFAEECSRAGQALKARHYFRPYIEDLIGIARAKGVEVSDQKVDHYRTTQEVVDDINRQLQYEEWRFPDTPKGYRQLEHDIVLWHFVRDQRPLRIDSPVEADYWIVTLDFRFLSFDRHKRRSEANNIPICVHPANFVQMLQFWVPRTQDFEEAVLGNLRLPFLFQEFDRSAEQLTIRILSALARFEKIDDFPQEVVASTLMNSALRQRLEAETAVEKDPELVSQVFVEENRRLSDELSGEKAKTAQLKREAHEEAETTAELQRQEKRRNEALEESERQLKEERASRTAVEKRLETVEAGLREKEEQQQITWFAAKWVIAPLALIAALGLGLSIALATLSELSAFSSALTAIALCSMSLVAWVWAADLRGSRDAIVSQWRPFSRFHGFKKWLFTVLGLIVFGVIVGVLANATWDSIEDIF